MSGINTGRVLLGGLLAGLVINIGEFILNMFVIGSRMEEFYERLNLEQPGGGAMAAYVVMGFVIGITTVWVYAAARPRLGPGPQSAAIAAMPIWIAAWLAPIVGYVVQGMATTGLGVLIGAWGLVELILASVAGAWLYTEGQAAAAGGGDAAA